MSFSESRVSSRGPLIAVIKIELDANKVDRIFLHQNDDDHALAVEFVNKHNINKMLVMHIHQRIKMSRAAIQNQSSARSINYANRQSEQMKIKKSQTKRLDFQLEQQKQQTFAEMSPVAHKNTNPYQRREEVSPPSKFTNGGVMMDKKDQANNMPPSYDREKIVKQNKVYYQDKNNINKNKFQQQNEYIMYTNSESSKKQTQTLDNESHTSSVQKNKFLTEKHDEYYHGEYAHNNPSSDQYSYPAFKKNQNQRESQYESSSSEGLFQKNVSGRNSSGNSKDKNQHERYVNIHNLKVKQKKNIFGSIGHLKKKQTKSPQAKVTEFYQQSQHEDSPLFNQIMQKVDNKKLPSPKKIFESIQKQQQPKYSPIQEAQDFPYISFSGKKPQNLNLHLNLRHNNESAPKCKESQIAKQNIQTTQRAIKNNNSLSINQKITNSNPIKKQLQLQERESVLQSGQIYHNRSNIDFSARGEKDDTSKTVRYSNTNSSKFESDRVRLKDQKTRHQLFQKTQKTVKINQYENFDQQLSRPSRVKILNKQDIMSLKQSHLNKSLSKSQIKKINHEVTSRLYNQTDIKKKYLHAIKSRAKLLQDQQDLQNEELTHRPQINPVSQALAEGRREKPLQEYLMQQGKLIQIRRQESVSKFVKKQLQKCSFKPQINPISKKLAVSRSRSRINSSITDSKCQKNGQIINKFKPQINSLSSKLVKDKGNFFERQKTYIEQKNSKLFQKIQQKRFDQKRDMISGQNLFRPQIKDSKIQRNRDVYEYLYALSKKNAQRPKSPHKPFINSQSQRLVQQMQQKRLTWIFSQLDSDNDGIISARKICVDQIPEQILLIIAPVLYQMQEINQSLNLQQFKNAVTILQRTLDLNRKNTLYNYRKSGQFQNQLKAF